MQRILEMSLSYQIYVSIFVGMLIQYSIGKAKRLNVIVMILLSSFVTAAYITHPTLMYFGIYSKYPCVVPTIYVFSSISSVHILSVVIASLPKLLQYQVNKFIGDVDENRKK